MGKETKYLSIGQVISIAAAILGLDPAAVMAQTRLGDLGSALSAPESGFGDVEFYPTLAEKAAILGSRIARNHALVTANKRTALASMQMFLMENGFVIEADDDEKFDQMLTVTIGGDAAEDAFVRWVADHMVPYLDRQPS